MDVKCARGSLRQDMSMSGTSKARKELFLAARRILREYVFCGWFGSTVDVQKCAEPGITIIIGSHSGAIEALCYRNGDELRPDGHLARTQTSPIFYLTYILIKRELTE